MGEGAVVLRRCVMLRCVAYHWYPSFQSSIPLEFIALVSLEEEFAVKFRPGYPRIGVEICRVLREACLETFFALIVCHCQAVSLLEKLRQVRDRDEEAC